MCCRKTRLLSGEGCRSPARCYALARAYPCCSLRSCTKGILNDTLETPHDILRRVLPERLHPRLAYLSGPSFAAEVGKEIPTAVTIASENDAVACRVQELMSTPRFRCYRCVIGVTSQSPSRGGPVLQIAGAILDCAPRALWLCSARTT